MPRKGFYKQISIVYFFEMSQIGAILLLHTERMRTGHGFLKLRNQMDLRSVARIFVGKYNGLVKFVFSFVSVVTW